jgi:hypothetical protein
MTTFCYAAVIWFMWWLGDVLLCHVIHMCVKNLHITAECFVLLWVSVAVSYISVSGCVTYPHLQWLKCPWRMITHWCSVRYQNRIFSYRAVKASKLRYSTIFRWVTQCYSTNRVIHSVTSIRWRTSWWQRSCTMWRPVDSTRPRLVSSVTRWATLLSVQPSRDHRWNTCCHAYTLSYLCLDHISAHFTTTVALWTWVMSYVTASWMLQLSFSRKIGFACYAYTE